MTALDNSDLPPQRSTKLSQDAQIMIKMLPNEIEAAKKLEKLSGKKQNGKIERATGVSDLHNSVSFDYNEDEGRFAVAKNDIKIGEKILVEEPHCCMLLEKFSKTNCQHCFKGFA